jgi:hypothetical protein
MGDLYCRNRPSRSVRAHDQPRRQPSWCPICVQRNSASTGTARSEAKLLNHVAQALAPSLLTDRSGTMSGVPGFMQALMCPEFEVIETTSL